MSSLSTVLPSILRKELNARARLWAGLCVALLVAALSWIGWNNTQAKLLPGTPASASLIEATWGVQIKQVGVTADGGLIDLRLIIIDPDKAGPLFSLDNRPRLYAEESGKLVDSLMHPPHAQEFAPGQVHYLLYNNTGGAIQRGMLVSIVLGDLRLEHIVAK